MVCVYYPIVPCFIKWLRQTTRNEKLKKFSACTLSMPGGHIFSVTPRFRQMRYIDARPAA